MSAHELSATPPTGDAPRSDAPVPLSLAGVAPDGTLILTDHDGGTFVVDVDARLRAALPDRSTAVQARKEPPMESVLRPRDIQARIRAGESPEQVAAAAQTSVEKVMPFAGPVLAEREHVASRAQKSSLRRTAGSPPPEGGARTLGDVVATRLRHLGVDPHDLVDWDAWRREDGRWSLTGHYRVTAETAAREGTARFTFDPPGNFVTLENDDAHWLIGDLPDPAPQAEEPEPNALVGVRRLAAVRDQSDAQQLSIDDALGLDADDLGADSPVEAFLDDRPGADESDLVDQSADAAALDPDPEVPTRRPVRKTRGRASVPSWDEIMFGPAD